MKKRKKKKPRRCHANILPSQALHGHENNIAQPKSDECPSSACHCHRLTVVLVLFCSFIKGDYPENSHVVLCLHKQLSF